VGGIEEILLGFLLVSAAPVEEFKVPLSMQLFSSPGLQTILNCESINLIMREGKQSESGILLLDGKNTLVGENKGRINIRTTPSE